MAIDAVGAKGMRSRYFLTHDEAVEFSRRAARESDSDALVRIIRRQIPGQPEQMIWCVQFQESLRNSDEGGCLADDVEILADAEQERWRIWDDEIAEGIEWDKI